MIDPTLSIAAYSGLEKALNTAISLDRSVQQLIHLYTGKVIQLVFHKPDISLYIKMGNPCSILHHYEDTIDAGIEGELSDWLELASSTDKASALINSDLSVHGNSQLLVELSNGLKKLDIDWEGHLAKIIGDVPAHLLGRGAQKSLSSSKKLGTLFAEKTQQFIYDDPGLLPKRSDKDALHQRLRALEMRIERVYAKLGRLDKVSSTREQH